MDDSRKLLQGQIALVSGASSGIGAGIATALAAAGAIVAVNHRGSVDKAADVLRRIESIGGTALPVKADVSVEADVVQMFDEVVRRHGRIDIVVANAGVQKDSALADMSLRQWQTVIDINLTGQFLCTREAVRHFLKQEASPASKARGKIICMSSVHQLIPWAGHANYAASKGGVMQLVKSLALEVADRGIRVNGIAPGAIKTPINEEAWSDETAMAALLTLIPYGRIGETDDVARAAVWLASDEADYITGTTLFVDGGMSLYPGFKDNG